MKRISSERKIAALAKLLQPYNMTVAVVAQMEGISEAILYNWRNKAKSEGKLVPGADKNTEQWLAELEEYCRKKRFYPEQLVQRKQGSQ
ncbi:transposase [Morganella psychrotolerans]|uniref:Transposase n=1 Tax=Morganella psychrotolerans TaxID=368603 RepID=A0A5M9QZQ0_9GAMM|nr:transposase [Morganella psychrotolerans]KAA8713459.1 transposase [Morganella psychrotolerans]